MRGVAIGAKGILRRIVRCRTITKMLVILSILLQLSVYYIFVHSRLISGSNPFALDSGRSQASYLHLIDLFDPTAFARYPLEDKCHVYFNELYNADPSWSVGDFGETKYLVPLARSKDRYEKALARARRKTRPPLNREDRELLKKDVLREVTELVKHNLAVEEMIVDAVGRLRVFGSCVTGAKHWNVSSYDSLEHRLFPWLSMELPVFERWDGTIVRGRFPTIGSQTSISNYTQSDSFTEYLLGNMSGKGIVLTISDRQVENTIRLFRVLRYLRNEIPIQIVHREDLSRESKEKLVSLARDPLDYYEQDFSTEQELWFVDVTKCISERYVAKFGQYSNKWLSVLFNSFKDIIFLDDDLVPFVTPVEFFNLPKYKKTGSLFYRDRELNNMMEDNFYKFYLELLPTELDEKIFGVSQIDPETSSIGFFKNQIKHNMESGLVVLDRKTHLSGLFVSTHLQIWTPTSAPVHGDKELFWLGQIMTGGKILFNDLALGSPGYLQKTKKVNELCSIQPAHIHDDGHTLMWVNSGLRECKYNTWEGDVSMKYYRGFNSSSDLREWFQSPKIINSVIIPPFGSTNHKRRRFAATGWSRRGDMGCSDYYFCAYDQMEPRKKRDKPLKGKLVQFAEEEQVHLGLVASIWLF